MRKTILSILFCVFVGVNVSAQTTSFTYQGSLQTSGSPANGNFDFEFKLFDMASGGAQQGSTLQQLSVPVVNGSFTVSLDFGSATLPGADRFLDIAVRSAGGGAFTSLSPRQPVTSAPYSVRSLKATSADTVTVAGVPFGSGNYIQNTTSPQASSNFNISGNGIINGNLGIGTASPGTAVDVQKSSSSAVIRAKSTFGSSTLFLDRAAAIAANSSQIGFYSAGSADFAMGTSQGSAGNSDFSIYNYGLANNAFTIQRSTGNIGFGTVSPTEPLVISRNFGSSTALSVENTSSGSSQKLTLLNYGINGAGNYWAGLDSANTSSLFAPNSFVLRSPGGLIFSGSNSAEHMRITANGNVGIGTNTPASFNKLDVRATGTNSGVYGESVSGFGVTGSSSYIGVYGYNPAGSSSSIGVYGYSPSFKGVQGVSDTGSGVYGISNSGFAGFFIGDVFVQGSVVQSSDARLKKDVNNLSYGLSEVLRLRPVTWFWQDKPGRGLQFGMIAQEVETVLPDLVRTDKDAEQTKGLNYIGLVPVTIKAIQEQQAEIEALQKANEQQQIQIKQLQRQIDDLKAIACSIKTDTGICTTKEK